LARIVRPLDWFGRFDIEQQAVVTPELWEPSSGSSRVRYAGSVAVAATFLRIPVTFWFAAPWRLAQMLRVRGRTEAPPTASVDPPNTTSISHRPTIGT